MAKKQHYTVSGIIDRLAEEARLVSLTIPERKVLAKHLKACSAAHDKCRKLCYDFVSCGMFYNQHNLVKRANKLIGKIQQIEKVRDVEK
jgi:hypothetical protein